MTDPTTISTSDSLFAVALAYAARGWHVFPLRPGDKRPAVRDWETRATIDVDRIERCWSGGAFNIGIACGPSGLVVVDLDTPKDDEPPLGEWNLPGVTCGADVLAVLAERCEEKFPTETYTVCTGRGGLHLYFRVPDGTTLRNTAGSLGWLVDTRATGGYVVAAGSVVVGRPYEVVHDTNPDELPPWLFTMLTEPPAPSVNAAAVLARLGRPSRYAETALRGELDRVLAARPGERNATLHRAAFALGQLVAARRMPEELATAALQTAGEAIGLSARECTATITSGLRGGVHRPRGGVA